MLHIDRYIYKDLLAWNATAYNVIPHNLLLWLFISSSTIQEIPDLQCMHGYIITCIVSVPVMTCGERKHYSSCTIHVTTTAWWLLTIYKVWQFLSCIHTVIQANTVNLATIMHCYTYETRPNTHHTWCMLTRQGAAVYMLQFLSCIHCHSG